MTSRETRHLLDRLAQIPGWHVVKRKRGHYKITGPRGVLYFTSSTPSDWRAVRNLRSDLRQRGAPV